jgi:hypothetical protein
MSHPNVNAGEGSNLRLHLNEASGRHFSIENHVTEGFDEVDNVDVGKAKRWA